MIQINKCPNCKKKLEKIPGRTTNCPLCKKKIYVRTRVKGEKKVLVDLEGVKQIDSEWTKYALKSKWFKILKSFGIKEKDYMVEHDRLTKQWGFNPRHNDIFWGLFNRLVLDLAREGNQEKSNLLQEHMKKFNSERSK